MIGCRGRCVGCGEPVRVERGVFERNLKPALEHVVCAASHYGVSGLSSSVITFNSPPTKWSDAMVRRHPKSWLNSAFPEMLGELIYRHGSSIPAFLRFLRLSLHSSTFSLSLLLLWILQVFFLSQRSVTTLLFFRTLKKRPFSRLPHVIDYPWNCQNFPSCFCSCHIKRWSSSELIRKLAVAIELCCNL